MQKLINELKDNINIKTEWITETEESDEVGKEMASPIEKVMYLSLSNYYLDDTLGDPMRNYNLFIEPQPEVIIGKNKYRPDFKLSIHQVIEVSDNRIYRDFTCYIECDGHDFHERTKEQAKKDRAKDRAFISEGLDLLRFTGSEIYNDHARCSDDILNFMHKKMNNKEFKKM